MSILITGGTGFIGSFLARSLLSTTDKELVLFDYAINRKRIMDIENNPRVQIFQGDVSCWSELISLFKKCDPIETIFHFGSIMPPITEEKLETSFRVNIQGTFNILECSRYFSIPKIIYSSSGAIYGPGVSLPINEQSYRDPWTFYGVGKVCSEVLGTYYSHSQNINFTALRLPALVGPGRTGSGMTIYSNNVIQYPAQGMKAICNVDPDVTIPILYIKDLTQVLKRILDDEKTQHNTYNIDGFWISAEELVQIVQDEIPEADILYEPDPQLSFQLRSWSFLKGEDKLARTELKYEPQFAPEKFVKDFIKEVQVNPQFQI
ncbi:MAG: NAD-dependent epimerase/dehydratase family protein [Candidatus Hodarchaeota archaeon]